MCHIRSGSAAGSELSEGQDPEQVFFSDPQHFEISTNKTYYLTEKKILTMSFDITQLHTKEKSS
jgi:hypothetical protein